MRVEQRHDGYEIGGLGMVPEWVVEGFVAVAGDVDRVLASRASEPAERQILVIGVVLDQ